MLQIDITSDIDAALKDVGDFFWNQVPFGTSRALNSTIFDVRKRIVGSTYPNAFTVRNPAFPRRLWRVTPLASKKRLETILAQSLDRNYLDWHAQGGTKRSSSGGRLAIPAQPEKMRAPRGRIRKPNKPGALATKKGVFVIDKGARKFILKRGKDKNELLYSIVPQAAIDKRFRFYEDATDTTMRVFSGHWNTAMNNAIRNSRFTR